MTATASDTDDALSRAGAADDLDLLLAVMPPDLRQRLQDDAAKGELLEVVLDLGRRPEARFAGRGVELAARPVSADDLRYVVERVGRFGADNRAGIERTLHRISALRNRVGDVVGLTCRVGRSLFGTVDIVRDVVESGESLLLLGRPGVGKTTLLREAARVLAGELGRRVVIVDTSNEIAGDGDIPHPGIGRARRMQVPTPEEQHRVMIEAVENHMPEVIVIDEIGTGAEALAARTIAERGVQLVATAHGNRLENLLRNPTLSDLVGGIHPVTLSDEEARRRGTQKTVLERKAAPTFDVVVEIQDRDTLAVHHRVGDVVDHFLRGFPLEPEVRVRTDDGYAVTTEGARYDAADLAPPPWRPRERGYERGHGHPGHGRPGHGGRRRPGGSRAGGPRPERHPTAPRPPVVAAPPAEPEVAESSELRLTAAGVPGSGRRLLRIFPYAVSRSKLERAIRDLRVPAVLVDQLGEADVVLTTKAQDRRQPRRLRDAELRGTRLEVVKSNSVKQLEYFLGDAFGVDPDAVDPAARSAAPALDGSAGALREAEEAIDRVLDEGHPVELAAQDRYLRRMQHELVVGAGLVSESKGDEPYRRVVVYPA